ncbi:aminotransferase class I and II [Chitinophaga parva]|uniref:Aminotransferase class I and II n=1 Tax=Chitinophaga parva TaxID=2169414 RepID=A0A2T7BPY8_9BACT|nr:HipA family kinase [Chitinophaga parva]PUZ29691.1 aminotransferase class I and II [Chitinophaga parva]
MQENSLPLRTVQVIRYVTPLREGGSLPAIAEADDGFLYVLKFRGAGQGVKSLIAELVGGEIARTLGIRIPEIVFAQLDEAFGRTEGDEEIQDLLRASEGLNLGLHYLSGSMTYDPSVGTVDPLLASKIVWMDCLLTNVDRTARNTNMLMWHRELWLIDHGASLYFHHSWDNWAERALSSFSQVKDHVLLPQATELAQVDAAFKQLLTPERIRTIVNTIPDEWLTGDAQPEPPQALRDVYYQFLVRRLENSEIFIKAANDARQTLI